jgi:hypothetical protein
MCKSVILPTIVLVLTVATGMNANAFDLTGLWATDLDACKKIFETKGKQASLRKDSDLFGSGFIIDGTRIRGRMATCSIKTSKEDGAMIHLLTSCATDIMLQNVQFSVKVVDGNKISRIFPGIDGMQLDYYRCPAVREPK